MIRLAGTGCYITELNSKKLRLKGPLYYEVEGGEQWRVNSEYIDEAGYGANFEEAMSDFKSSVVDLYFVLSKRAAKLGGSTKTTWERLKSLLDEE